MKTFREFLYEQGNIITPAGVRVPPPSEAQQSNSQKVPEQPQAKLAKNNFGGNKELENFTLNEVKKQGLADLKPRDAVAFFPNGEITPEGWVNVLSLVSYKESGWNPNTTFKEGMKNSKGETVVSTGLYQLSYESVKGYGFQDATTEKLKDPYYNTTAAIAIMKRGIERTGLIEQNNSYWSVLRPNHRNYAGAFIKKGSNPEGRYAGNIVAAPGGTSSQDTAQAQDQKPQEGDWMQTLQDLGSGLSTIFNYGKTT